MKSLIRTLLASILTVQSATPMAFSETESGQEVICHHCIDKDKQTGDVVDVEGQSWQLDKLHDVHGVPMWEAHPIDTSTDVAGSSFDHDNFGGIENSGNTRDFHNERLTGRDFSNYNDSNHYSAEERQRLQEIQQKIIARLNTETIADSEATNTKLSQEFDALNQAISDAGEITYHDANDGPSQEKDAMAALHDSIQAQSAGTFYSEQAGWQLYENREYQSKQKEKLTELRNRLNRHMPKSALQADAKRTGYYVLGETDEAYLKNGDDVGEALLKTAELLVDIATDIIPLTSVPKDFVRAVLGKDPMTGKPLQTWERAIAAGFFAAGVVSLGTSNVAAAAVRAIAKVARTTETEVAIAANVGKTAEGLTSSRSIIIRLKNSLTDVKLLDPVKENQRLIQERGYTELAWDERKVVLSGKTRGEQTFVRVFDSKYTEPIGSWLTEVDQIIGKTPEEIREALALKFTPDKYVVVTIPEDLSIHSGFVGKNKWGGRDSTIQHFIPVLDPKYFGPSKPLGKIFKGVTK